MNIKRRKKNERKMEKSKEKLAKIVSLIPETQKKVDFYKDSIKARGDLHNILVDKVENGNLTDEEKARTNIEIVELKDAIYYQQQIFEKYLQRLTEYESYMDDIYVEVENNFDNVMKEAALLPSNPRIMSATSLWKKQQEEGTISRQDRIEFYLLLKSEISNSKKNKRR